MGIETIVLTIVAIGGALYAAFTRGKKKGSDEKAAEVRKENVSRETSRVEKQAKDDEKQKEAESDVAAHSDSDVHDRLRDEWSRD